MNTFKLLVRPFTLAKEATGNSNKPLKQIALGYWNDLNNEYKRQKAAFKDLRKTNYDLGLTHYYKGNYYDARLRFKILKWFKADTPEINYFIGRTYFEQGNFKKAKEYLNLYKASNDQRLRSETDYTLNIIDGKFEDITSIPPSLISHTFDLLSPFYNEYISSNKESSTFKLYSNVNRLITEKGKPFGNNILDLGCGTGTIGKLCRQNKIASYITGVDLSQLMVEQCKEVKFEDFSVYNEIHKTNALEYTSNSQKDQKFDIIFASDLPLYCSNFTDIIKNTANTTVDKGILAFSCKTHLDSQDIIFNPAKEEFTYNLDYITKACTENWQIIHQESTSFVDGDEGIIIILQKVI